MWHLVDIIEESDVFYSQNMWKKSNDFHILTKNTIPIVYNNILRYIITLFSEWKMLNVRLLKSLTFEVLTPRKIRDKV